MQTYYRILAIDYGEVRIGLAQTDLMQMIASPLKVIKNNGQEQSAKEICDIILQNEVKLIVLGLPLNMDGTEGDRAKATRAFGDVLAKFTKEKIVFQDERLSSVEAEDLLIEGGVRRENRKNLIDKVAACIILESFLNSRKKEI